MKKRLLSYKSLNLDLGLLILRFFTFAFLMTHGWPKFQKLIAGNLEFFDPIGIGSELSFILVTIAEFVCAILIIIGMFTRPALVVVFIAMFVVAFVVHGDDPFGKKEHIFLYLVNYIVLFLTGPGKYSVDGRK